MTQMTPKDWMTQAGRFDRMAEQMEANIAATRARLPGAPAVGPELAGMALRLTYLKAQAASCRSAAVAVLEARDEAVAEAERRR